MLLRPARQHRALRPRQPVIPLLLQPQLQQPPPRQPLS
jgi:hypothetical protein